MLQKKNLQAPSFPSNIRDVLPDPVLKIEDPGIAIRILGTTSAHDEASDAHHLAIVDSRTTRVAVAGPIVLLVDEAQFAGETKVDQLLAQLRGDRLEGVVLQVARQIALMPEPAPAGNDDARALGRVSSRQANRLDAGRVDQRFLQAQQGDIVLKVAIVLMEDHLGHLAEDSAAEPIVAARPHSEALRGHGHILSIGIRIGHTVGSGQDEVPGQDRAAAAVGAAIPQGDLMRELILGGIHAANDASVDATGGRLHGQQGGEEQQQSGGNSSSSSRCHF
ncbi:hypothetical protein KR038_004097 [Drosophila bunnanda]|nr:hypothetical protein KR038_004097 [Drosophila bunnanda]